MLADASYFNSNSTAALQTKYFQNYYQGIALPNPTDCSMDSVHALYSEVYITLMKQSNCDFFFCLEENFVTNYFHFLFVKIIKNTDNT